MHGVFIAVDAPTLTSIFNLLIAFVGATLAITAAVWKLRKWQKADMTAIVKAEVKPVVEQQQTLLSEQTKLWGGQQELSGKFDKLSATVAGQESRLSFLEGRESLRTELRTPPQPVPLTDEEGGAT